jgi:hypothetical protein
VTTTAEMLRRAQEDVHYAQAVLDGTEGNEEVRDAIRAHLAEKTGTAEVAGYAYDAFLSASPAPLAPALGLSPPPQMDSLNFSCGTPEVSSVPGTGIRDAGQIDLGPLSPK